MNIGWFIKKHNIIIDNSSNSNIGVIIDRALVVRGTIPCWSDK